MSKIKKALLIFLLSFFFVRPIFVAAESESERLERLTQEIQQYEEEINKLKSQASTLSNQIAQYDAQIRLTTLKIAQTEEKILLLGGRIDQLETSLTALTKAFTSRVVYTYKMSRLNEAYLMLIFSSDLNSAISSFHYLQKIQEADRDLLVRLEKAQVDYQDQKSDQEELQKELEEQKNVLGAQKTAKAVLLEQTRNDERRYQQLLAAVRAEFEAIQAIIAGKGQEEEVGKVSQGQRIASIIQGPSCNSSGSHLHFIISQNGAVQNPFSYLKNGVDFENCSGSACGSSDGDSFNPAGSWDWPLNPAIELEQGYGSTWATRNSWVGRIYNFHNGIDINGSSNSALSVADGDLYRGSYSLGCVLPYVKLVHKQSNIVTYYLHVYSL